MDYHEIGEIFEHDGVVLEVVEYNEYVEGDVIQPCYMCFFNNKCTKFPTYCTPLDRKDREYAYYKLVGQCKQKDIEQKTEIERIMEERQKIEQKEDFVIEGTGKVFATHVGYVAGDSGIYSMYLDKLFTTYRAKDKDYGSAFSEMFDELGIDYAYGKLREKINRIKVLRKQPNMVENEGLEDALLDTAGYAILTLVELKKRKQ